MERKITPITLAELEHRHETMTEESTAKLSPAKTSMPSGTDTSELEEKLVDEP